MIPTMARHSKGSRGPSQPQKRDIFFFKEYIITFLKLYYDDGWDNGENDIFITKTIEGSTSATLNFNLKFCTRYNLKYF